MRGVETLKMSNEKITNTDGIRVPPWLWALIVSLVVNALGAAYVTGRVTEKLEGISYRVGRLEAQFDRYMGVSKP